MTGIDLDAIWDAIATVRLWAVPDTSGDLDRFARNLAEHADALLARLAEVEADVASELLEVARLCRLVDEIETENTNLAAENARLRQVVEAAEAWRAKGVALGIRSSLNTGLADAVDAYRAGQKAPADAGEQIDRSSVNDPPGLSAALVAGVAAAFAFAIGDLGLDEDDQTDVELGIGAAVRAAAPALRAGALREAADEIHNRCQCRADEDLHCDHWRDWLRERADRIGGAT